MRFMKLLLMSLCLAVCIVAPSSADDPYKTNPAGFGPRIAGARLGVRMTLQELVKWRASLRGLPFIMEINSAKIPGRQASENGSISLEFTGKNREVSGFRIVSASRSFYRFRQETMRLQSLLAEIDNAGVETVTFRGANGRIKEDCISFTDDMRVASVRIRKSDMGAGNMTHEGFVREMTKSYSLPEMRRRGSVWDYRNEREGWQITYHALGEGIFMLEAVITD